MLIILFRVYNTAIACYTMTVPQDRARRHPHGTAERQSRRRQAEG